MTIALWCVLVAGLLPYVATAIAKGGAKGYDNRDPRGWLEKQQGVRRRANFAQMNAFEAFPLFAAGVLVAEHLQAPQGTVDGLATRRSALSRFGLVRRPHRALAGRAKGSAAAMPGAGPHL
ncbi:MAG: MAPEG family protein [Myxococcales bacterium]|nr:MAPEG family protein [Myxococcota bacterium]MDW8284430.1 MAPEG family protein [Myxococcales bacterium]